MMSLLLLRRNVLRLPYSIAFAGLPNGAIPGWLGSGVIAAGVASVVPTALPSVVVNGDFSAWTGDNPDSWDVVGEAGADPMVTEVAGKARIYTSAGILTGIKQNSILTLGAWYYITLTVSAMVSNTVRLADYATTRLATFTSTGAKAIVIRAANTGISVVRDTGGAAADFTVDNIAAQPLTLSTCFSGPALRLGRADVRVRAAWSGVSGLQFGLAIVNDPTNPTVGLVAYHTGVNAVLEKFTTATTWTTLVNAAAAYGAGREVEIRRSGGTCQLFYDSAQVGVDQSVTEQAILDARWVRLFATSSTPTCASLNVVAN